MDDPKPGLSLDILKMESWTHMWRTANIIIKDVIHVFASISKIMRILLMGRRNRDRCKANMDHTAFHHGWSVGRSRIFDFGQHWHGIHCIVLFMYCCSELTIPSAQQSCWGVYWFHSIHPSVRPSRIPCLLCSTYSFGWIHFIFLYILTSKFGRCVTCSPLWNFKIKIFGNFLNFVTLTLSCFDLGSDVNH